MARHRLKSTRLHRRLTLILILASAAFLLFEAVRHDCWEDEGFTLRRIGTSWTRLYNPFAPGFDARADPFDRRFTIDYNPPLYFALLRLLLGADPSLLAVRAASIAGFFIGLAGLHFWARRALGLRARTFMLFLYVVSPAMIFYGTEGRPYMLPVALATVAFALIWSQAAHPARLFAVCLFFSLCGCLMNFHVAWLVITLAGVMGVGALRPGERIGRPGALASLAGLAIGSALALAVIFPQRENLATATTVLSDPASLRTLVRLVVLPVAGPFTTTVARLQPVAIALWAVTLVPMLVLIGSGLARVRRSRRGWTGGVALALWLGPLVLMLLAHALLRAPIGIRYATLSLPGWLMFAAWIAREISRDNSAWHRAPSAALGALLLISIVMDAFILAHPTRPVWGPAIAELKAQAAAGDRYTFDPDEIKYAFAVNAATPPRAKYFALAAGLPQTAGSIWLVAAKTPDPKIFALFDKNGFTLANRVEGNVSLWQAKKK